MKVKLFILVFILLFLTGCTHNVNHNNFTEFSTLIVKPTIVPTVPPSITEVPMILPEVTLNVSVVYRPITVSGLQMVWFEEGKGVELDLNNDEAVEQIYLSQEGIYINGSLQNLNFNWKESKVHNWERFWVVDVDNSDDYINLIFSLEDGDAGEALTYFDGELKELARMDTFGGNTAYSTAEYFGNGMFVVESRQQILMNMGYFAPVKYEVTAEGKVVQLEEFIALVNPYPLELLETLEMYREPDLDSAKFSVSPQMVMALATSPDWVQLRLNDETEAWIYVEFIPGKGCIVNQEKTADILFDGFSNAG